jgi:hypothetical protein
LHQKDFGDLLAGDEVRYDVVGDATLAPDEIEVKFGHAVYLPAPDEKMLYNVSISRDSAIWHTVCAIYPNQRLALIGGDGGVPVQGWPFGSDAALLILNDGPDAAPVVQVRPKGAFDATTIRAAATTPSRRGRPAPAAQNRPHHRACRRAQAEQPAAPPAVGKSAAGPIDLTAVPAAASHKPANRPGESDATYAPVAQQRVSLVALALPRLSRYRDTGALAMELPFNRELALTADAQPSISLMVDAADQLYASTAEAASASTFPPPSRRWTPHLRLLPAAPEMATATAPSSASRSLSAAASPAARFTFGATRRCWRLCACSIRRASSSGATAQRHQHRPHRPVAQRLQLRGRGQGLYHCAPERHASALPPGRQAAIRRQRG